MIPLSVLDLAPIVEGGDAAQALHQALDLARHAERLGYNRYWLAEHHNMAGIASAATSVVIAHVAGGTSTIRVGAGGIDFPQISGGELKRTVKVAALEARRDRRKLPVKTRKSHRVPGMALVVTAKPGQRLLDRGVPPDVIKERIHRVAHVAFAVLDVKARRLGPGKG